MLNFSSNLLVWDDTGMQDMLHSVQLFSICCSKQSLYNGECTIWWRGGAWWRGGGRLVDGESVSSGGVNGNFEGMYTPYTTTPML